jgi:hypothetical protein
MPVENTIFISCGNGFLFNQEEAFGLKIPISSRT